MHPIAHHNSSGCACPFTATASDDPRVVEEDESSSTDEADNDDNDVLDVTDDEVQSCTLSCHHTAHGQL